MVVNEILLLLFTAQKLVLRREPVPAGAVKPEFIQRIQDVEIVEGSAAKFDVRVKGNLFFNKFILLFLVRCMCFPLEAL